MPYRRRSYPRRSRYGRRYRRRRPNAARATPRITFAPRHQYLKLRWNGTYVSGATIPSHNTACIFIPVQSPGTPLYLGTVGDGSGNYFDGSMSFGNPLGWTEYKAIFQKFVVAGFKYRITFAGDNRVVCGACPMPVTLAQMSSSYATISTKPYYRSARGNGTNRQYMKGYVNCNTLNGLVVKKHDDYVHDWTAGAASAGTTTPGGVHRTIATGGYDGNTFGIYAFNTDSSAHRMSCMVDIIWYLHALSTNSAQLTMLEAKQVEAITSPLTSTFGEPSDPGSVDIQQAADTGYAHSRSGLSVRPH